MAHRTIVERKWIHSFSKGIWDKGNETELNGNWTWHVCAIWRWNTSSHPITKVNKTKVLQTPYYWVLFSKACNVWWFFPSLASFEIMAIPSFVIWDFCSSISDFGWYTCHMFIPPSHSITSWVSCGRTKCRWYQRLSTAACQPSWQHHGI